MVEFYSDIVVRVAVLFFALWAGGISTTLYGRLPSDTPIGPKKNVTITTNMIKQ